MPLNKKIFLVVSLLYILYTIVPNIQDLTGIEIWIINLFTFIILLVLYPWAFNNPVIHWFLAYAAILAIYVLAGKPLTIGIGTVNDNKKIIIEIAFLLPSISIFSILYYLKDNTLYKAIAFAGLLFVLIHFTYLTPMILSNSEIMRVAHELNVTKNYKMPGMPNYTLMHAYVIALSALLYGFKIVNAKQKVVMLSVLVLFVFIILHTYITTLLIITFTTIIFTLLYDTKNKVKSFLIIFLVAFVIYILNLTGVFVQFFDFLIRLYEGTAVEPKIKGFKYIYLYGDVKNAGGHITGRMNYHDISWKAFSENFLIGGSSPVGGHSSILDRLGGMGLIAFIPFVMMIISQIRMILQIILDREQKVFYFIGLTAALTLLYQKGLFGQEGWLFLMILMPGLIITFRMMKYKSLANKAVI